MATPSNAPAKQAPTVAIDGTALLGLALRLGAAHDGRAVSTQHLALAELVAAYRSIPDGAAVMLPLVTPADQVVRELADGHRYEIAIDGAFVRLAIHDVTGDNTLSHLEPDHVRALIRDLQSVLAAREGRRG